MHIMRTCINARMSLNYSQIRPPTTGLAAFGRLKYKCLLFFSVDIDPVLFKLAGFKDMHKILEGIEFLKDQTTYYGVSCP